MKEYVKYLVLCPGLSHLPSLLRQHEPGVLSIGSIMNCFLYNIFLGQHQPNIASEIGKIWFFRYTVTQQDRKNHKFFERCLH